MNCYGKYHLLKTDCRDCKIAAYCKESGDPPLLSQGNLRTSQLSEALNYPGSPQYPGNPPENSEEGYSRQQSFSRHDMLELMTFLLALDLTTLDYLEKKMQIPTLKFSDLAGERQITRQAVHKYIRQKCECVPELAIMLKTRKQLNKQKKNSLLDEWHSIRKRNENSTQKGRTGSFLFFRGNQSFFDLSNFRMLKGGRLGRNSSRKIAK